MAKKHRQKKEGQGSTPASPAPTHVVEEAESPRKCSINAEVEDLSKILRVSPGEKEKRDSIMQRIEAAIQHKKDRPVLKWYPDTRAQDLEIYLETNQSMRSVKQALIPIAERGVVLTNERIVPYFICFISADSGYRIVIYALTPEISARIKYAHNVLEKNPVAGDLFRVLAHVMQERGIWRHPKFLGEYELLLMLEFLLATHPLMQGHCIDASRNKGALLMDFLQLFGCELNHKSVGIDPKGKKFVKKTGRGCKYLLIIDPITHRSLGTANANYECIRDLFEHMFMGLNVLINTYSPNTSLVSFWLKEA